MNRCWLRAGSTPGWYPDSSARAWRRRNEVRGLAAEFRGETVGERLIALGLQQQNLFVVRSFAVVIVAEAGVLKGLRHIGLPLAGADVDHRGDQPDAHALRLVRN